MTARRRGWARSWAIGLGLAITLGLAASGAARAARGTLWDVVQACLATHRLTGGSFPCLSVPDAPDLDRGVAILRAPFRRTHVIVMPTRRISGVEDPTLQQPGAPPYFAEAWAARQEIATGLGHAIEPFAIGLAVNSKGARTQDQLHVHVDCLRQDVEATVRRHLGVIQPGRWNQIAMDPLGPFYWSERVPDLAGLNVFRLVADGVPGAKGAMAAMTIAAVPAADSKGGFVLLAGNTRLVGQSRGGISTGEDLLDHACTGR